MLESGKLSAKCLCGRMASRAHCPQCGCSDLYAYAHLATVIRTGGKPEAIQAYRCKGCGHKFTADDLLNCQAPQRYKNRDKMAADTPEKQMEVIDHFQDLQALQKLMKN